MRWLFWRQATARKIDPLLDEDDATSQVSVITGSPVTIVPDEDKATSSEFQNLKGATIVSKPQVAGGQKPALRAVSERAPRANFRGVISFNKADREIVADALNISATGIYMATPEIDLIDLGEVIEVTVAPVGLGRRFQTRAKVVRKHQDGEPVGFGLCFELG